MAIGKVGGSGSATRGGAGDTLADLLATLRDPEATATRFQELRDAETAAIQAKADVAIVEAKVRTAEARARSQRLALADETMAEKVRLTEQRATLAHERRQVEEQGREAMTRMEAAASVEAQLTAVAEAQRTSLSGNNSVKI